eukprot:6030985-Pyramimonas_sp.AAC.1
MRSQPPTTTATAETDAAADAALLAAFHQINATTKTHHARIVSNTCSRRLTNNGVWPYPYGTPNFPPHLLSNNELLPSTNGHQPLCTTMPPYTAAYTARGALVNLQGCLLRPIEPSCPYWRVMARSAI